MHLTPLIIVDILDVWGINFIGPYLSSFENDYILLCADYVSKWVETIPTRTNKSKVVVRFLRQNIFDKCGMSKVIISD